VASSFRPLDYFYCFRITATDCKACPFWYGRQIAGRLEPRAELFAYTARAACVFPATSKSSLPLSLRYWRLDIANDRLTILMDDHALDPDDLRAFASLPIQRVEHVGHRTC
jgi:hypothetical protein